MKIEIVEKSEILLECSPCPHVLHSRREHAGTSEMCSAGIICSLNPLDQQCVVECRRCSSDEHPLGEPQEKDYKSFEVRFADLKYAGGGTGLTRV
jgi:hypothetical protein